MKFWTGRWAGAAVVAITLAVYAPVLAFHQVSLDDSWLWSDTSPLRDPSARTLALVWTDFDADRRFPLGHEYLPVRDTVVMIDMAIWGDDEQGPHATQLALFLLSVYGLGALLARFGFARDLAWLGALVWAIHPLHVESVAWLAERKGVLAGLFVVAFGHAWLRYREGRSRAWLALAVLAAVAGVWSKAPAMFGPPALLALDWILLPRTRRRWLGAAVLGIATLAAAVPVIAVANDARIIDHTDAPDLGRVRSFLGAAGHYAQGAVMVRPTAIDYPIQTDGPATEDLAIGAVLILGGLALAWRWRRKPEALALLAWTWIWFVPISHLFVSVHILVADRFAYFWVLGPAVGAVLAIDRLGRARAIALLALVSVLAISSLRAEGKWASSVELFTSAVDSNPGDPLAYKSLAYAQRDAIRPKRGLATVERGLARFPMNTKLMLAKADMLDAFGAHFAALHTMREIAATGAASAQWRLAEALERDERTTEALPLARAAYEKHPELPNYAQTYGRLALVKLDPATALRVLAPLRVKDARDYLHLGIALDLLGRPQEADAMFAAAIDLAPGIAREIAARQWR